MVAITFFPSRRHTNHGPGPQSEGWRRLRNSVIDKDSLLLLEGDSHRIFRLGAPPTGQKLLMLLFDLK